jgi:hypothetical protein
VTGDFGKQPDEKGFANTPTKTRQYDFFTFYLRNMFQPKISMVSTLNRVLFHCSCSTELSQNPKTNACSKNLSILNEMLSIFLGPKIVGDFSHAILIFPGDSSLTSNFHIYSS